MDLNEHSAHALQWVMENMVEDGDEVKKTKTQQQKTPFQSHHQRETIPRYGGCGLFRSRFLSFSVQVLSGFS